MMATGSNGAKISILPDLARWSRTWCKTMPLGA